jgi:hypothetical protein
MPKSMTFGCGWPSTSSTSRLAGLRSQWTTPRRCAWPDGAADVAQTAGFRPSWPRPLLAPPGIEAPSRHVLHREPGRAVGRAAGIEDLRDAGMRHPRQRLALDLEARPRAAVAVALRDQLDRDLAADRFGLLGQQHQAHAAAAERALDAIAADAGAGRDIDPVALMDPPGHLLGQRQQVGVLHARRQVGVATLAHAGSSSSAVRPRPWALSFL